MYTTLTILPLLGIFIALSLRRSMATQKPLTLKQKLWIPLIVWAVLFPAVVIGIHMNTRVDVVSWQDTVATCLAAIAIGVAPLAFFYLFSCALYLTRRWEAKRSLATSRNG